MTIAVMQSRNRVAVVDREEAITVVLYAVNPRRCFSNGESMSKQWTNLIGTEIARHWHVINQIKLSNQLEYT